MRRALLLVAALVACAPEEIIVASADATLGAGGTGGTSDVGGQGGAGGDPEGNPTVCGANEDCDFGEYCAKSSCGAQKGVCDKIPAACDGKLQATCGCGGITYWNDCLRRAAGSAYGKPGECKLTALACGGKDKIPCPTNTYCAKLVLFGFNCPPDVKGYCWGMPGECDMQGGGDRYKPCAPGPGECLDSCRAIKKEEPYIRTFQCPK